MTKSIPAIADLKLAAQLAIRARFLLIGFWFLFAIGIIVLMAAQFSGRQPSTVALDMGLSSIRLALPVMLALLMQELFSKEFERRYYLSSLSYPRPRYALLLGRFIAAYGLIIAMLVAMGILLAVLLHVIGLGYAQATPVSLGLPYTTTMLFIAVDLLVIAAIATLLAVFATTPGFVLIGTLGFMLIARSYSAIIDLLQRDSYVVGNPEMYQQSLGLLGYVLPDLGALDVRMIALYDNMGFLPADWPVLVATAILYSSLLLGISLWLFNKRRFN